MKRLRLGVAVMTVLLGTLPANAQYRFPDPTVLVGPGPSIGVRVRDLTADELTKARLESPGGVFVESVSTGTPAEKAGIKSGDIIVEFDGERVRSVRGFTRLVSETPPQRTVRAVVLRDGARQTLSVTPTSSARNAPRIQPDFPFLREFRQLPELRGPASAGPGTVTPDVIRPRQGILRYRGFIGLEVQPVTGQMADYFGVSEGVLVSSVDLDSPSARAGLKAGDVITAAGGQAVKQPADVAAAVRKSGGSKLELKIVRDRKEMTITVDVPGAQPMLL